MIKIQLERLRETIGYLATFLLICAFSILCLFDNTRFFIYINLMATMLFIFYAYLLKSKPFLITNIIILIELVYKLIKCLEH